MFILSFQCPRPPCLWLSLCPPKPSDGALRNCLFHNHQTIPSSSTSPACSFPLLLSNEGRPAPRTPHTPCPSSVMAVFILCTTVLAWKLCCCRCSQTLLPVMVFCPLRSTLFMPTTHPFLLHSPSSLSSQVFITRLYPWFIIFLTSALLISTWLTSNLHG